MDEMPQQYHSHDKSTLITGVPNYMFYNFTGSTVEFTLSGPTSLDLPPPTHAVVFCTLRQSLRKLHECLVPQT